MIYYAICCPYGEELKDVVYTQDEAILRDYMKVFNFNVKKSKILKLTWEQLKAYQGMGYCLSELELIADDVYGTPDDLDFIACVADQQASETLHALKKLKKDVKLFRGKASKKLIKAIDAFIKERVPNEDWAVDPEDTCQRLEEKLNIRKTIKSQFRS